MSDTIRMVFTYLTVQIVVAGGGLMIYLTRNDPSATDMRILIGGFIGSALTFAFSAEVAARTSHQQTSALNSGLNATPNSSPNGGGTSSVTGESTETVNGGQG